jgi:hypothetical protein
VEEIEPQKAQRPLRVAKKRVLLVGCFTIFVVAFLNSNLPFIRSASVRSDLAFRRSGLASNHPGTVAPPASMSVIWDRPRSMEFKLQLASRTLKRELLKNHPTPRPSRFQARSSF